MTSLATFQMMMNDLFWDLINQGDTVTFIDNILVATDTKKEYNKLVEEVLKRLKYHKWSLTICDGCFDTLKSSKMQS